MLVGRITLRDINPSTEKYSDSRSVDSVVPANSKGSSF